MNLEQALELYDDWRDNTLDAATERELIAFLEADPDAATEFEMRDEALGALSRAASSSPDMSPALAARLKTISAPASGSRRGPRTSPRAGWLRIAAAVLAGILLHMSVSDSDVNPDPAGDAAQLALMADQNAELVRQLSDVSVERERLSGRLEGLESVTSLVDDLRQQNIDLMAELSMLRGRLETIGSSVQKVDRQMTGLGENIQLLQQGQGGRLAIIRGDTPSQQATLKNLRDSHREWASMIDPLVDAPDGELEMGAAVFHDDSIPIMPIHRFLAAGLEKDD